ncbi:MAG: signal peptide peptidase SppA [Gemmataceae bacterium]
MLFRRAALLAGVAALVLSFGAFAEESKAKATAKPDKPAEPVKKTVTLAHIKLSGGFDEKAPTVDPLLGQLGETFKQKIDRLKKARDDKDIQAVLLEINGAGLGWGKLHELTRAIASVRSAGKKVYAHIESGNRGDYLLALAADDVCLPEASWLMLNGIRAEATFYKGLLEKFGIKADMLQMGDFKGAAEPYTRDSLSDANRKQLTSILDDFYAHEIVGRIAEARKLSADKVKHLLDEGPFSAPAAKEAGLVDRLDNRTGYEAFIKKQLGGDTFKVVEDYGKKKDNEDIDIFGLYRKLLFGPVKFTTSKSPKLAVIYATGPITTGKSGASFMSGESMGSDTIVKAIHDADKDESVKAIVLRIDSPGGSALASDLIWKALRESKKPIIASMSDVAGSGGYYIAMAASKIYAEPGTITGSIGVVGGKMALRGLYDKVGIKTEVISRGKNSGMLVGSDPFSPSERAAFKKLMEDTYHQFVSKALEGRQRAGKKMTREELLALAGGRIYTGRQAKANGLIDEVGTLEEAITAAARAGGLPADKEPELLMLPKAKNSLEALLGSAFNLNLATELRRVPELARKLQGVEALFQLRNEPVWALLPFRLDIE